MRKFELFIIFVLYPIILIGQQKFDTAISDKNLTNRNPVHISINLPETLQIKDVSEKQVKMNFFERNMPWIVALLIGLASAYVNFWIAHRLRQSNEINLQKQINNSKETTLTQFKATIATKNRQDWINELRQTLSDYLASITLYIPLAKNPDKSNLEERKNYVQRMALTKSKLELLMNEDKPEQKALLDEIEDLLKIARNEPSENQLEKISVSRTKVIIAARHLFTYHWTKIKELK